MWTHIAHRHEVEHGAQFQPRRLSASHPKTITISIRLSSCHELFCSFFLPVRRSHGHGSNGARHERDSHLSKKQSLNPRMLGIGNCSKIIRLCHQLPNRQFRRRFHWRYITKNLCRLRPCSSAAVSDHFIVINPSLKY